MKRHYEELTRTEAEILTSCGWTKVGSDLWREPDCRSDRTLPLGHAVNSELKLLDLNCSVRLLFEDARRGYLVGTGWVFVPKTLTAEGYIKSGTGGWGKQLRSRTVVKSFDEAVNVQKQFDRGP